MSILCSQIEVLTDLFFCAQPDFNTLTLNEQVHWLAEYQNLTSYRETLVLLCHTTLSETSVKKSSVFSCSNAQLNLAYSTMSVGSNSRNIQQTDNFSSNSSLGGINCDQMDVLSDIFSRMDITEEMNSFEEPKILPSSVNLYTSSGSTKADAPENKSDLQPVTESRSMDVILSIDSVDSRVIDPTCETRLQCY